MILFVFSVIKIDTIAQTQSQEQTDTIIYGLPFDFSEFSAYTADSYATDQWVSAVYSGLLKRSNSTNNDWIGDMATDLPTVSNNGLTFNFTLRDNLYFSNGKPLTSDDVEFSLDVTLNPNINVASNSHGLTSRDYSHYLENSSFTKISKTQFSLTLIKQYAFAYSLFTFPLIPQETFGENYQNCLDGVTADCAFNNPDGSSAISSGPFMIKSIDSTNQIVTLTANPYYWNAGSVKTNRLIFEKIADKAAAISALSVASINILDSQYIPGIDELNSISGISQSFVGDLKTQEVAINHKHPYFGTGELIPISIGEANQTQIYENARLLRRAMSMIMDRDTYINLAMKGLGRSIATTFPPGSVGFDPSIRPEPFNLTIAREIMKKLGFNYTALGTPDKYNVFKKSFFNITVLSPNTNCGPSCWWSDTYAEELKTIGIGVLQHVSTGWAEIVPRTFGSVVNPPLYNEGGYDIFAVGYGWHLDWNPDGIYEAKGSCSTGDCRNFYNFDLYENMTPIAKVVREYLSTLDFDLRVQYASELQQLLHYWNPVIPILSPKSHWAWTDTLTGIDPKLLSQFSQDWGLVSNSGFQLNTDIRNGKSDSRISISGYFFLGFPVLVLLKRMSKES